MDNDTDSVSFSNCDFKSNWIVFHDVEHYMYTIYMFRNVNTIRVTLILKIEFF